MKIAVLITCFNRVQSTLSCLTHLFVCDRPVGVEIDVFLVDDASPDGTGEKVKSTYPSVNVIQGTGKLYWCAGMRLAWNCASKANDYDGYLWLNDDTFLHPSALQTMFSDYKTLFRELGNDVIIAGCVTDLSGESTTYSGHGFDNKLIVATGTPQRLQVMNGNCVFISKKVFKSVGNFPNYFTHAFGDFDYSLRADKLGIPSYCSSTVIGRCGINPNPIWRLSKAPLLKRAKDLYSPKNTPYVLFRFCLEHNGFLYAVRVFIQQHIKVLFPRIK